MHLFILCLFIIGVYSSQTTIEYYKNLIQENFDQIPNFHPTDSSEEFRQGANSNTILDYGIFDFVIVGAGTAGNVLATRLSEIEDFSILLLEAGDEEDDFSVIPDGFVALQTSRKNWAYFSQPNNYSCQGRPNQMCELPRGKGIGGSNSINAVMYVRAGADYYNEWLKKGLLNWSYLEVLHYFMKSENTQVDGDKSYHNKGGLLNVQYALPHSTLLKTFLDGCAEVNVPRVDFNGKRNAGAGPMVFNIKHGKRQSTGAAFLDMARQRKNLKVVTKALATKILLNGKKAEGVEFVTYDKKYKVRAKREVILSAGAINSPQLLMLSGIGPKDHLQSLGIKVVADLPVGKTLKDHVSMPIPITTNYVPTPITFDDQIKQYLDGYGPFTKPANIEGVAFLKTNKKSDQPTIEILLGPPSVSEVSNFNGTYGIQGLRQLRVGNGTVFVVVLLDSKSTGDIKLKSTDPLQYPLINANLLSHSEDRETLKQGVRFVRKLLKTKPFTEINAQERPAPICTEFDPESDEFLNCLIPKRTNSFFHISVTTPMGINPKTSVVDAKLKVHGIRNLRVVDAGVLPTLISGHTNAPTIMVAEKISDAIKLEHTLLPF